MASVTLNINDGTAPYTISIKKTGDSVERYVSYSGGTLTFNAVTVNENTNYTISVTDSNDCQTTGSFSLNCYVEPENPLFASELIQPTCLPDGTYTPARFELTTIQNVTRYKICINELDFTDCGDCTVSDGTIFGSTASIILPTPTIPTSWFVIIRGYKDSSCSSYYERTGTIITPTCEVDCNMSIVLGDPTC